MHTLLSLCSNLYHLAARHFTAAMPSLASWTGSLCWEHLFLQAPSPMLPSSFRSGVNIPSSQETSLEVSMLDYWAETYDKSRFSIGEPKLGRKSAFWGSSSLLPSEETPLTPLQCPWPSHSGAQTLAYLGSSLRSPAEGEGHEGFPPPPDKDLESPSSTRLD